MGDYNWTFHENWFNRRLRRSLLFVFNIYPHENGVVSFGSCFVMYSSRSVNFISLSSSPSQSIVLVFRRRLCNAVPAVDADACSTRYFTPGCNTQRLTNAKHRHKYSATTAKGLLGSQSGFTHGTSSPGCHWQLVPLRQEIWRRKNNNQKRRWG